MTPSIEDSGTTADTIRALRRATVAVHLDTITRILGMPRVVPGDGSGGDHSAPINNSVSFHGEKG